MEDKEIDQGNITVRTEKGTIRTGNLWEVICVLCFKDHYVMIEDITELSIDGHVIPKKEVSNLCGKQ